MGGTRLFEGSTNKGLARLMAFIDGGYLRRNFEEKFGNDNIKFDVLKQRLVQEFDANCNGNFRGDLVRAYFYDAIVDESHPKYKEQDQYFDNIEKINGYELRLGDLIPTGKNGTGPLKQKGVDVRLAVDMITKSNQYDFAILLAGDGDFLDSVDIVKEAGKRVFGIYFPDHISVNLHASLDARINITNFLNLLKF